MAISFTLTNLEQSQRLGELIGQTAQAGDIFLLHGDLGSGKTTLTQAIGQGLEVEEGCYITSPTFSLMHEYPGRLPLYHFDLYRLEDEEEIAELGFVELLHGPGVAVVEWPDRLGHYTPQDRFDIFLQGTGLDSRQLRITGHGSQQDQLKRFQSF